MDNDVIAGLSAIAIIMLLFFLFVTLILNPLEEERAFCYSINKTPSFSFTSLQLLCDGSPLIKQHDGYILQPNFSIWD